MKTIYKLIFMLLLSGTGITVFSQSYSFPDESEPHEGTWLQWPHQYEYGMTYRNENDATWVAMTNALQANEKVHIIAYNTTEKNRIISLLTAAGVPLTNVDFKIFQTNDVWVRDNGPIYVRNSSGNLVIEDWGFNGWGGDYNFNLCNPIPASIATATGTTVINLNSIMVNEGGAIEMDGNGVLLATKSAVLSQSNPSPQINSIRNPGMTEAQANAIFAQYLGATKFYWLDGGFSTADITDFHIDGFAKFAPGNKLVTMNNADLLYWGVTQTDINTLYGMTNANNVAYTIVYLPLTQNDVVKTDGTPLGYKGSYANYYVANNRVLVPNYNDPNDVIANNIIAGLYPGRTVVGIDVRNLYGSGGMVHCVTQQQPVATPPSGSIPPTPGTINGNSNICSGSINTYSVTAVPGATSYNWTLPNGWTGTSATNTITTTASANGGTISVTASNSNGSSSPSTLSVVVTTVPATPGIISGNTNICAGSINTYSVTAVAGATAYNWTLPGGWTGTSSSNSITATASTTSGNITVSATNACGTSAVVSKAVTVNTAPATPGSISGNATICSGSGNTYSVTAVAGATSYNWTLPGGWTGTSSSNSITATASATSGNITVSAGNVCGTSAVVSKAITVTAAPATPGIISGNATICSGSGNTYSVTAVAGATSYNWTLPGGWTGTSSSNSITATASATSGNITVSAGNVCGTSAVVSKAITVINSSTSAMTQTACTSFTLNSQTYTSSGIYTQQLTNSAGCDSTLTLNLTIVSPVNYSQTISLCAGQSITVGANTYTTSGVYTDTFTAANGCDSIVTTSLTVNGQIDISTNVNGTTITANASNAGYQWINCDNGNMPVTGENNQSFSAINNGNYAVVITDGSCSDTSACVNINMTGINKITENNLIHIYPNPSDGLFNIILIFDAQVVITDAIGRVIWNNRALSGVHTINLQNESNGVYFVKVNTTDGQITKRIIINK